VDPSELLERLARSLSDLEVPYLVTGSMATIAYGEPRFTNDVERWARKLGLTDPGNLLTSNSRRHTSDV
jgi:hypothetical protein